MKLLLEEKITVKQTVLKNEKEKDYDIAGSIFLRMAVLLGHESVECLSQIMMKVHDQITTTVQANPLPGSLLEKELAKNKPRDDDSNK